MEQLFTDRILNTPSSFIREILKVTQKKDFISFAGGLPNPVSFPKEELKESMNRVILESGDEAFQYATTEGHYPLREYIANHYKERFNMEFSPDDILITTGSQQGLDLMGKVLINKGDIVCIEKPGYLGAIQAFSMFEPKFEAIELSEDGLDINELDKLLSEKSVKLMYLVPNFQNPTGITYSRKKRKEIYELLKKYNTVLIEDDPYGELRFEGEDVEYIGSFGLENSVLFGSISKIITPGMRLGWICTKNKEIMKKLVTAKQASDLHSNIFSQYTIFDYLEHNDLNIHIDKIKKLYKSQSSAMIKSIDKYFPKDIVYTSPQGGMFMWVKLPNGQSSLKLFDKAIKKKVAFVPGNPFYTDEKDVPTLRLNYTNTDIETIDEGIRRLASIL